MGGWESFYKILFSSIKMAVKRKVKEIKLPMRFNPGLEKYEPVLPLRKADKNIKFDVRGLIWLFILIIVITLLIALLSKYVP